MRGNFELFEPGKITIKDEGIIANDDDGSASKFIIATSINATLITSRKDEGTSKTIIGCKMNEYKAISTLNSDNHQILADDNGASGNIPTISNSTNATTRITGNEETITTIINYSSLNDESQKILSSYPSTQNPSYIVQTPTITCVTEAESNGTNSNETNYEEKTKQTVHLFYTNNWFIL